METAATSKILNYNANNATISGNNAINTGVDTSSTQTLNTSKTNNTTTETIDLSSDVEQQETKGFFESIGEGLSNCGAAISNGFKSAYDWASNGIKEVGATLAERAATMKESIDKVILSAENLIDSNPVTSKIADWISTGAVVVRSVESAIWKIGEHFDDFLEWTGGKVVEGVTWLAGETVGLFDEEAKEGITEWREGFKKYVKEEIARDKVGEINKAYYENDVLGRWVNAHSAIKYDSEVAQKIQGVSEKAFEFAAATGLTIATAGAGAPIAFGVVFGTGMAEGIGKNAEKVYVEKDDANWKDEIGILIRGAGEGLNWYAQGKLGSGLVNGLGVTANYLKGAGTNLWTKLKNQGLKTTVTKVFSKDNLLGAAKKAIFDTSNLRDSLAIAGDNVAAWITGDEEFNLENVKKALGEIAIVYGTSTLTDVFIRGVTVDNAFENELLKRTPDSDGHVNLSNRDLKDNNIRVMDGEKIYYT